MKTAWRCGICGEDFPPDKTGWLAIRDHAEDAHQTTPKECCQGVVNVETGEVLQQGWSPTVLAAARRRGWVADKDGEYRVDKKYAKSGETEVIGQVVPINSAQGKVRNPTASMTVVAKNVVVDETVQLLFIQAQAMFDYENTPQDFSRFVTEFVVMAAAELGLDGAVMFTNIVQETVAGMMQGLQPASEEGAEEDE